MGPSWEPDRIGRVRRAGFWPPAAIPEYQGGFHNSTAASGGTEGRRVSCPVRVCLQLRDPANCPAVAKAAELLRGSRVTRAACDPKRRRRAERPHGCGSRPSRTACAKIEGRKPGGGAEAARMTRAPALCGYASAEFRLDVRKCGSYSPHPSGSETRACGEANRRGGPPGATPEEGRRRIAVWCRPQGIPSVHYLSDPTSLRGIAGRGRRASDDATPPGDPSES